MDESKLSIQLLESASFDTETINKCLWKPYVREDMRACANETRGRYDDMVKVFPESRNQNFEKRWEFVKDSIYGLGVAFSIIYQWNGSSYEITDIMEIENWMQRSKFSKEENTEWLKDFIDKLRDHEAFFCSLANLKDSQFKNEIDRLR